MRSIFFPVVMIVGVACSTIHPANADGFGYQDGNPAWPNSGFDYQTPPDAFQGAPDNSFDPYYGQLDN